MDTVRITSLLFLVLWSAWTEAFNIDLENFYIQQGINGSMFGYAVALHIDQATSWLLVGAPKAQTSQEKIKEGGAVYRCRINRKECDEIPFDISGNAQHSLSREYIEDKSGQWFGATVKSSGENGVIVACAPRYQHFFLGNKREPVGRCLVNKPSSVTYDVITPCMERGTWGFHREGHCQAGMTASLSEAGRKLLIGTPGSYFWQGQVYNINLNNREMVYTSEGMMSLDNMYLGFSSATGEFTGDDIDEYVVGAPRSDVLLGKVVIYTQNLTDIDSIIGEQFGEYFGYSVGVTDVNGDGLDDIMVGAPMYSEFKDGSYETGRVFVFYQSPKHTFSHQKRVILLGKVNKGRFGWDISALSDINYDGFNDFVTSAPYGGKDGNGAVFIYHGSSNGVIVEPAQVIEASVINPSIKTFGYSLSGGLDLDGNVYPDLLVGAYESENVVFLRTRPVVKVKAQLILSPVILNLDTKNCVLLDGSKRTCMDVTSLISYRGTNVPKKMKFEVTWTLDSLTNRTQRAFYLANEKSYKMKDTIHLFEGKDEKIVHRVYLKNNLRDKLTPIGVGMNFKLSQGSHSRRKRHLKPILDKYIETTIRTEAQILKDCGLDNICIPDLVLQVPEHSSQHIVGERRNLQMLIKIENKKEDAFEAQLVVKLPKGVSYVKVQDVKAKTLIGCNAVRTENDSLVICEIGNPLQKRQKVSLLMKFSPKYVDGSEEVLKFHIHLNTSNSEAFNDTGNNSGDISIPVKAAADVIILGKSTPDQIIYNSSQGDEIREKYMYNNTIISIGPAVEHLYEVRNRGDSDISTSRLTIRWPSYDDNGNTLLKLLELPKVISGEGSCTTQEITPTDTYHTLIPGVKKKREAELNSLNKLSCTDMWCNIITCNLGALAREENILVLVKSKLLTSTLLKRGYLETLLLVSEAKLVVTSIPYDLVLDPNDFPSATKEVSTLVNPQKLVPKDGPIQIWVIIVSVAAGILLLFLIIVLLWWCGFFKRWKPEDMKESNGDAFQ